MTRQHMLINLTGHFLFFFYNSRTLLIFSVPYPSALQLHFQVSESFHDCSLLKKDCSLNHFHPYPLSQLVLSLYFYPFVPSNNSFTFHFLIFQISSLQCSLRLQSPSSTPSSLVQLSLRRLKILLIDISCV